MAEKIVLQDIPCVICKKSFSPTRKWSKFCSKNCRWSNNDKKKQLSRKKISRVGSAEAPFGHLKCASCGNKFRSTMAAKKYCSHKCYRLRMSRNWVSKNRARGLCYSCENPPVQGTSSWCEKHWLTQAAWRAGLRGKGSWKKIKLLLELQNYICPYTGKKLVIGVNASVDHKLPRSKYPDLVGDISNYEWVDEDVNRAKRAMTKDEFISMCRLISGRFK